MNVEIIRLSWYGVEASEAAVRLQLRELQH